MGTAAEAKTDETILDVARRAGIPLANSCGGIGVCARCRVTIMEGANNMTPRTAIESRAKLAGDERFACQAVVIGDCAVTASYW
jgi:2Fe-2S ferredoxin